MTVIKTLRMKLGRYHHTISETRGLLVAGKFTTMTAESPWKDNILLRSCIPLGNYRVIRVDNNGENNGWMIVGVPGRPSVELRINAKECQPMGDILLSSHCHIDVVQSIHNKRFPTSINFDQLTEGLSSFTLEITQAQPYNDYLLEHGYASPQKEGVI